MYDQTYYWRVRGLHVVDTSDWSGTWTFTTNSLGATPISPGSESVDMNASLILSINKVAGSTTLEYHIDTVPTFNSEQLQSYSHSDSYGGQRVSNLMFNETYYWRVRGMHVADTSSWSEVWSFTTNPLGVTQNYPSNGSVDRNVSLILGINKITGSSVFEFQLDTVSTFNSEQLQSYSQSESMGGKRVSDLLFGQTYYWRVRGLHIADTSSWSEIWSFTTKSFGATPSSPTSGSIDRPTSLTLWINKVEGAENIDYQLDTTNNFNSALLHEYTHTDSYSGHTVNDLRYGQKYFWRVRGWHEADESEWSSVWDFTTGFELTDGPALVSPENNANDISYENIIITWSGLASVSAYQFQLSEDVDFTTVVKSGKTSLTFTTFENLNPSKTYYWRVRGENVNGYSPWSAIWLFNTAAVELTAPIQVSPENNVTITETAVNLIWNEVLGANSYKVQVSLSENFGSNVTEYLTEDTVYGITGLSPDLTYYWRVKAFDNSVESNWSETWSFTVFKPSLDVPVLLFPESNATEINLEGVAFNWDDVFGANSYTIEISEDESFGDLFYTTVTDSVSKVVNGFVCETVYYWRVNASNESVISDWSEVWSFETAQCIGINKRSLSLLKAYPNPAKDYITVDVNMSIFNATVDIFSSSGKHISSIPFSPNFDISHLKSGFYLLQIRMEGVKVGEAKFLKE